MCNVREIERFMITNKRNLNEELVFIGETNIDGINYEISE